MSNAKKRGIVISASMAILAVHAMSVVAKNSEGVVTLPEAKTSQDIEQKIESAVNLKNVKAAVETSFSLLASKFGSENVSIGEKYFPGAFDQVQLAASSANSRDFTSNGCYKAPVVTACHAACHTACHSACHGSRSWR
jgi:hypothetical protein|nr:hypothetical protein [Neorhizobium tomejilense]